MELMLDVWRGCRKHAILVAFGGCQRESCLRMACGSRTIVFVTQTANLSDHTIYGAYAAFTKLERTLWTDARFVLLHDTCRLTKRFDSCMHNIATMRNLQTFVFAHTYGLYNMGVATHTFMLTRAAEWHGIRLLQKKTGIALEQGANVMVDGKLVTSLHHHCDRTLATAGQPWSVDSFSVQPCEIDGEFRYVSYIAAFGVYKLYASASSFAVPVFAADRPQSAHEREYMLRNIKLTTSWAPLLPHSGASGGLSPRTCPLR